MVEGLHALVNPLPAVLPGLVEPLPMQLMRIDLEDLAAEPLDRLDLDPPGSVGPAGRLHRPKVTLERLRPSELLQVLDALLGGAGLQGMQQQ